MLKKFTGYTLLNLTQVYSRWNLDDTNLILLLFCDHKYSNQMYRIKHKLITLVFLNNFHAQKFRKVWADEIFEDVIVWNYKIYLYI